MVEGFTKENRSNQLWLSRIVEWGKTKKFSFFNAIFCLWSYVRKEKSHTIAAAFLLLFFISLFLSQRYPLFSFRQTQFIRSHFCCTTIHWLDIKRREKREWIIDYAKEMKNEFHFSLQFSFSYMKSQFFCVRRFNTLNTCTYVYNIDFFFHMRRKAIWLSNIHHWYGMTLKIYYLHLKEVEKKYEKRLRHTFPIAFSAIVLLSDCFRLCFTQLTQYLIFGFEHFVQRMRVV